MDILLELKKYLNIKNPLFQFFVFLIIFSVISLWDLLFFTKGLALQTKYISTFIITLTTAFCLYVVAKKHLGFQQANPLNFMVTGMIIFLLIHPSDSLLFFVMAVVLAWLGKYFFSASWRINGPIFNPAALGLTLTYIVTSFLEKVHLLPDSLLISWWGADIQQKFLEKTPAIHIVVVLLLLFAFVYFGYKFKKTMYSSLFFLTYMFCIFFYNMMTKHAGAETIVFMRAAFFNSTAFLTLVMLPEPKTSPNFPNQQLVIGVIAGLLLFTFTILFPALTPEPFIATILCANLMTLFFKQKKLLQ